MSKSEQLHASNWLNMKAIIICDDFASVAKAKATLQRVGCRADVSAQWTIKSWPVKALNQAAMAEKILVEAVDAHLVVIPARRAQSLPIRLRDWLERWAALRQIQEAALAFIDDGIDGGFAKTVCPELSVLVWKHGLSLINGEGAVGKDAAKVFVRSLREGEPPLPVERLRIADKVTPESFRGLGINE